MHHEVIFKPPAVCYQQLESVRVIIKSYMGETATEMNKVV